MNTPGYDCRVKQIMSDWMVSIPATLKNSQSSEYTTFQAFASELTLPSCSDDSPCTGANQSCVGATATTQGKCVPADDTPQPYVEVMPGSPGYDDAVTSAQARLAILHTGINPSVSTTTTWSYYGYCPDTSDILDPAVVADPTCHPVPTGTQGPLSGQANGSSFSFTRSLAGINDLPDHAHWVITDTTQRPGPYAPRQGTWVQTLVQLQPEPVAQGCTDANLQAAQLEQQEVTVAVDLLQSASLADVNPVGGPLPLFATTPYPMGLWLKSSGCDFSSQHPVSWYDGHPGDAGDAQPDWLTNPAVTATVAPSDPVYAEWPGAAVFNLICVNCHGPNYDGTGRLADNLLTMTGGNTQVADLHDGLFGPVSNPGANRASAQAFGLVLPAPWDSVSVDDRAARYMAFMGLGGTDAIIPESILQIVGNTAILGVHIVQPSGLTTANMLSVAKYKCLSLLFGNMDDTAIAPDIHGTVQVATQPFYTPDPSTDGTFLAGDDHLLAINGDAELWMRLCSLDNPPPIRAVDFYGNLEYFVDQNLPSGEGFVSTSLFPQSAYSSAPAGPWTVGNDRSTGSGSVDTNGVAADNLRPWCLRQSALNNPPSGGDGLPASPPPSWWPICPPTIDDGTTVHNGGDNLPDSLTGEPDCTNGCWSGHDADRWAVRGAINAGLAVFLYLDALTKGTTTALPGYDACHSLP
jgi:mono/diheme cytochrome c family protein